MKNIAAVGTQCYKDRHHICVCVLVTIHPFSIQASLACFRRDTLQDDTEGTGWTTEMWVKAKHCGSPWASAGPAELDQDTNPHPHQKKKCHTMFMYELLKMGLQTILGNMNLSWNTPPKMSDKSIGKLEVAARLLPSFARRMEDRQVYSCSLDSLTYCFGFFFLFFGLEQLCLFVSPLLKL